MVIDTSKWLSGSWKTSVMGLITFLSGFIAANPQGFIKYPTVVALAKYIAIGGVGVGLFAAKDSNVTGGTSPNPNNSPATVAATAQPKV